jgi:hypothetical protein
MSLQYKYMCTPSLVLESTVSKRPFPILQLHHLTPSHSGRNLIPTPQILDPVPILIRLGPPVQRRPLGLVSKQPHRLRIILLVRRKPMVDPRRHDHQIELLELDPDPVIVLAAHIEVAAAVENVPNLLVFVQVLGEEGADFGCETKKKVSVRQCDARAWCAMDAQMVSPTLINVPHGRRRDGYFIPVFVVARGGERVYVRQRRVVVVQDAELGEVFWRDFAP